MFETKYLDTILNLLSSIKECKDQRVINVLPYSRACNSGRWKCGVNGLTNANGMTREGDPCGGHMGGIIRLEDGSSVLWDCSAVELASIMYYHGINNTHFAQYVDTNMRNIIDMMKI